MTLRSNKTVNRRSLLKAATTDAGAAVLSAPVATQAASSGSKSAPAFLRHQDVDSLTLVINPFTSTDLPSQPPTGEPTQRASRHSNGAAYLHLSAPVRDVAS